MARRRIPGWLGWTALLGGMLAVVWLALAAGGVFDPAPVGAPVWQTAFGQVDISAEETHVTWLDQDSPDSGFSVKTTVRHLSGELDVAYGLVVGSQLNQLILAASPLGYAAMWQAEADLPSSDIKPWQVWPHVALDGQSNELWIMVLDGTSAEEQQVIVYINREKFWEGVVDVGAGRIGLFWQSFGETAVIEFTQVQLFAK